MKLISYTYKPSKSIDVYKQTQDFFSRNIDIKRQIDKLGWVYNRIDYIIPVNEKNMSAWEYYIPFIYSWEELQVSFNLICLGLYKQAFVSLRIGLELGMLSVYFNINDQGLDEVVKWFNSLENTPRSKSIWKILKQNENIKKFDKILEIG